MRGDKYRRQYGGPQRINDGVNFILALTAALIVGGVAVLIVVFMLLFAAQPSLSADVNYRIPEICKPLASRYGVPETVSREQAITLMEQLNRYSRWPGVRQCRNAVIKQWVFG